MKVSKKSFFFLYIYLHYKRIFIFVPLIKRQVTYEEEQQDWIRRLCAGEEKAYRFFFDVYYQILSSFAIKYVREKEVAEDIVNDVVLEMYRSKKKFTNLVSLKSYLFTSIKNRCLNYIDHRKAQERYLRDPEGIHETDFFLDSIIEEEVYFLMLKAITELPDKMQEIYKLSFSGESNESIAEKLGLTVDSVKAYKKRGKQILKEKLQNLFMFLCVPL